MTYSEEIHLNNRIEALKINAENSNTNIIKLQETTAELIANISHIQKNIGALIDIIGKITK